eukprot:Opistho-2@61310
MLEVECPFDIIPVAASRIKMMCELQAELDSGRAGFAESKIWTNVVEAMGIHPEQLVDAKEYARKLIPQELETYNAVDLVKAVKSIFLDTALKDCVDDVTVACEALIKFFRETRVSTRGAESQHRTPMDVTAVHAGVNHFHATVSSIQPALQRELRVSQSAS